MYLIWGVFLLLVILTIFIWKRKHIKDIESFRDLNPAPSPDPGISKDNLEVLLDFQDDKKEITISLDLVYLDPKYDLEKTKLDKDKIKIEPNDTWDSDYLENICQTQKGTCVCHKQEDGTEICGVPSDGLIYECPGVCLECNKCHGNIMKSDITYQDFCSFSTTEKEKERCEQYKERIVFSREKCVFKNPDNPLMVSKPEICEMFPESRYNGYIPHQDIILKLKIDYASEEVRNNVKNITIMNVNLGKKYINKNIFYSNKDEIYFFLLVRNTDVGFYQLIDVEGIITYKDKTPDLEFLSQNVVNIINLPEVPKNPKELQKKIREEQKKPRKMEIQSSDFDRFSNNYLGENRYYKCQTASGYSVMNPITDLENGSFKRKKLLDNPTSWKQRNDVNRPWDYIINS